MQEEKTVTKPKNCSRMQESRTYS